eukprot:CAMPEP_0119477112 /NCGR_PEP_ID=MMETSP1344-20130328/7386_1 /TAXON_ID=236787 /ORGANISM="Florenciella parvula, Strain CCMP2471" /LENGTH=51 /DNA_ID=CAMNT_0007511047 /DNA_START=76 /DNA_END=227 /DNA_ORIENTATION=+
MDHGSWIMDHGSWIMDHGSWIMDHCDHLLDRPVEPLTLALGGESVVRVLDR